MSTIRRPGAASATVLIGLTTSLLVAHAAAPEWSRSAGLDVWNMPALEESHRAAVEQRAEFDERAERFSRRREIANQIAARLVEGTTPLPNATDEARAIFADDLGVAVTLESTYDKVPTERLRFACHMIERATRLIDDDPVRVAAVRARLEAEYQKMAAAPESPGAP